MGQSTWAAPGSIQNTNTKYKTQNTKYKTQNTKYKIQNTKYKIQNTKYNVCPITRTTLLHLPQIHPQIQNTKHKIQNTKYKIQNKNTKYARLPAQHYCTFHKYIHKYKIQNTK